MTISFVSIFTFVWILENKSREPLKTRQYVTAETLTKSPEGVGAAPPRKALMDRLFYNTPAPTPLKIRGSARGAFVMR